MTRSILPPSPQVSSRVVGAIKNCGTVEQLHNRLADNYHPETNPNGVISLGVAENALMYKELIEFVNRTFNLDETTCTYGSGPTGSKPLRTALANFLNQRFNPATTVKPEHIVISSGVTAINDMLAWTLAEMGDAFMIGRPFYSAFPNDFFTRSQVQTVGVAFDGTDPFMPECVRFYERALQDWNQHPVGSVRALVIINPHNPLGQCYSHETLIAIMKLCQKYQIHLISDEIYALSSYDNSDSPDGPRFTSVLSIETEGIIDPSLVHVLYGMSKDFCANGFRLGAFISQHNSEARKGMRAISGFAWPSGLSDHTWTIILNNSAFLQAWTKTNSQRLSENYRRSTAILKQWKIKYHNKTNAGLFLWVDLEEYLPLPRGWEEERQLAKRFLEGGIYLAAGEEFCSEQPGRFRIMFSMPWEDVKEGIKRMVKVLGCVNASASGGGRGCVFKD